MKYVLALLLFSVIVAGYLAHSVSKIESSLAREKEAHSQTRKELESALSRSEALADNARRCLAREAKAQADAAERTTILANASARERTPEEKEKVVDDATRSAVINRLNRGLREGIRHCR